MTGLSGWDSASLCSAGWDSSPVINERRFFFMLPWLCWFTPDSERCDETLVTVRRSGLPLVEVVSECDNEDLLCTRTGNAVEKPAPLVSGIGLRRLVGIRGPNGRFCVSSSELDVARSRSLLMAFAAAFSLVERPFVAANAEDLV